MIQILKASAGSGKTFNLAKEYIELLMQSGDPYAYRHILAVTFTNKATDEMKQRILDELDCLASSPEKSKYMDGIRESTGKTEEWVSRMAEKLLGNILNDYSSFSVSTIDRFFQRTLKAFSKEIGQFASYQVELDKKSLVNESVDRILDSLTQDSKSLLEWLTDSVTEQLNSGGRFSLDQELYNTAEALRNDEHNDLVEKYGIDENAFCSRESLKALKKECDDVVDAFVGKVKKLAGEIVSGLDGNINLFFRGFATPLGKCAALKRGEKCPVPKDNFLKKAADKKSWLKKDHASRLPEFEGWLERPLAEFCALFGDSYKEYLTAETIRSRIFSLGLQKEINDSFTGIMREKNVLSIDDSNTILKGIIDGCDAPFIYEKLGVRLDHFLIDEFQDTARIQWDNFRPLLADSIAKGNGNLIVGDVKQSIYRWRGSDWKLLDSTLLEQFPDSSQVPLLSNWRSADTIVEFNNSLYPYAAMMLDRMTGLPDKRISKIYSDVVQTPKSKHSDFKGNVDVLFLKDKENPDIQLEAVVNEVRRLVALGVSCSEIGVLVRTNDTGASIATALLEADIPVVSDDSLNVKMSPVIKRLVALLSFADNPEDKLNSFLASSLHIDPPAQWHSLVDLCEYFIRSMKSALGTQFGGEVPYIQAFMDTVQDWAQINGNSLSDFLKYWDGVNPKISSPDGADAVRIMTIHKSKGLAFPYVIFPYTEGVNLYKPGLHWCRPQMGTGAMPSASRGIYQVNLSSDVEKTFFAESYRDEYLMQMVDAINTFYVATTRAKYGMTIISSCPSKTFLESLSEGVPDKFSNFSQILYCYIIDKSSCDGFVHLASSDETMVPEGGERYRKGLPATLPKDKSEESKNALQMVHVDEYPSFPQNAETGAERLKFSTEAGDFFSEDGMTGIEASGRLRGVVLHDILSRIIVPEDLEGALSESFDAGEIDEAEMTDIRSMLKAGLELAIPLGWFPEDRSKVINETSIMMSDGQTRRPDRVVNDDGKIIIVDFKFGAPSASYESQVKEYADMYRSLGYQDVTSYLWYVPEGRVQKVS